MHFFLALPVDDQVARDGEEPRFKFEFAVVLVAAFKNADPSLLEKIFGAFFAGGDEEQIAEESVLIKLDQSVEGFGDAGVALRRDPKTRRISLWCIASRFVATSAESLAWY